MTQKELLTSQFLMVNMDNANISSTEYPIIGTQALSTCQGLLLYCEKEKIAIVAHISSNIEKAINEVLNILEENNIKFTKIKYKVITGYYNLNLENTIIKELKMGDVSRNLFNSFITLEKKHLKHNSIQTDYNSLSNQFAFDSRTGHFVTEEVFFGTYYYEINKEKLESVNKSRHR